MAVCIPCISKDIKQTIRDGFPGNDAIDALLDKVKACDAPATIQVCGKGQKKPRSAYQEWVSKCMLAKHVTGFAQAAPAIKDCAAQWKREKEKAGK